MTRIETRALVSRSPEEPHCVEGVVVDPPGPGEVRVAVEATAICHSDLFFMGGKWGDYTPSVFGHETAGVVTDVGDGVDDMSPGGRVVITLIRSCGTCAFCARGMHTFCRTPFALDGATRVHTPAGEPLSQGLKVAGFAGSVVVDRSQAVAVPDEMAPEVACLLACGVITGFGAVTRTADIEAGCSVAVVGAGGVGLNAVQGARVRGAGHIVAVDLEPSKLAAAGRFGATHTARPDEARGVIDDLTDGRGSDYVFVTAGSGRAIDTGMTLLSPGGALVVVGMPPNGVTTEIELGYLAGAGQRILGSKMGSSIPAEDIPALVELYRDGRLLLDELVTSTFPLEGFAKAAAEVQAGAALRNVITFG